MKNLIWILACGLIFSACTASPMSRNGVGSSGGGKGVKCRDSVRTLDLYEATDLNRLTIENPGPTLDEKLLHATKKYFQYFLSRSEESAPPIFSDAEVLELMKTFMRERFVEVAPGSIPLSEDATIPTFPDGCETVQIALYDDSSDKILLDPALWKMLAAEDQAALVVHEAIYKYARVFRSQTSDEARRFVGLVFSTEKLEPLWAETFGKTTIDCYSSSSSTAMNEEGGYSFSAFESIEAGSPGLRVQFRLLNGYAPLFKTAAFYPGTTLFEVLHAGFPVGARVARAPLTGYSWDFDVTLDALDQPGDFFTILIRSQKNGDNPSKYVKATCVRSGVPKKG